MDLPCLAKSTPLKFVIFHLYNLTQKKEAVIYSLPKVFNFHHLWSLLIFKFYTYQDHSCNDFLFTSFSASIYKPCSLIRSQGSCNFDPKKNKNKVKDLVNVNFVFKKCLRQIHLSINRPSIFYNTFYGKMCTFSVIYVMNRISLSKNV